MVSFANPLLLLAGLAAGLPILVHLLARARPPRIALPTARFLMDATAGSRRVAKLRERTLLAMRMLAVLLIALLFARPQWTGAAADDAGAATVIVLDVSASLAATADGVSMFDRAKAAALRLLNDLPVATPAGVVFADADPDAAAPILTENHALLREAIAARPISGERAVGSIAIAQAAMLLDGPGRIVVLSDGQASNWSEVAAADWPDVRLTHVPLQATGERGGAAVVGIDVEPAEPVAGEDVQVRVRVASAWSDTQAVVVSLQWAGGERRQTVEVAGRAHATAAFRVPTSAPGWHAIVAAVEPDDTPADDQRAMAMHVRDRATVRLSAEGADRFHLEHALRAGGYALAANDEPADVVVSVGRADRAALESDVPRVVWANAQEAVPATALTASSGRIDDAPHPRVATDPPPALQWMRDLDAPALATLAASPRSPVRLPVMTDVRTALWHADGSPAVAVARVAGQPMLGIANLPVAELALSPLFPSLVCSLVEAVRPARLPVVIDVGDVLTWPITAEAVARSGAVRLVGTGGEIPGSVIERPGGLAFVSAPLPEAGLYRIEQGTAVIGLAAAVTPAAESDPEVVTPMVDERPAAAADAQSGAPRELWPMALVAVAALLSLEALVAAHARGEAA